MTMIASAINDGVPIMISDILVSQATRPSYEVALPTTMIDVLQFSSGTTRYYPSFFNQKIYLVNDRVCIAFAGEVHIIKKALEDVRMFCRIYENVSGDQLGIHLANIRKDGEWENFACIAQVIEDDGILTRFYYNSKEGVSPLAGEVVASGSGSADFISETLEQASIILRGETNPYLKALQIGGILNSKVLSREWYNLHTINNNWGGGLELVFANRDRFEKLDNVVYIINHEEFDNKGKLAIPKTMLVLHYRYVGEMLIITALRPNKGTIEVSEDKYEISSKYVEVRRFPVAPLDANDDSAARELKELRPIFLSNIVGMGYVFTSTGYTYMPASFHIGPDLMVEYNEPDGLKITMAKYIHDAVTAAAEKVFSNPQ